MSMISKFPQTKTFGAVASLATMATLLLSACGAPLPASMLSRQAVAPRAVQAQTARRGEMQAQYFSVLLNLTYTPDAGIHFGFDRMLVEFADSQAKHAKLSITWALQGGRFVLNYERSGIGMAPVSEHISMDKLARRAEIVRELELLSGSDEDNAHLARLKAVIAPKSR